MLSWSAATVDNHTGAELCFHNCEYVKCLLNNECACQRACPALPQPPPPPRQHLVAIKVSHSKERDPSCTSAAQHVGGSGRGDGGGGWGAVTNVQRYVRGGRKRRAVSGYRCLHLLHTASRNVFQPTGLIGFGLEMWISSRSWAPADQGLMWRSGVSTVGGTWSDSGACDY